MKGVLGLKDKKFLKKAVTGVLVSGMLMSGGVALAGDNNSSAIQKFTGKLSFIKQSVMNPAGMAKKYGAKTGLLDELVAEEIITREQADKIKAKMEETAREQNRQRISDSLKVFVDQGTITQEQSDKILQQLEDIQAEHQALITKIRDMTQEERQKYLEDNREKLQNPLSMLTANGTITQEQADAIGKKLFRFKGFKGFKGYQGFKDMKHQIPKTGE